MNKLQKVAVILAGCGRNDGSEITEAMGIIINLSLRNISIKYFAPNKNQMDVIDHQNGVAIEQTRNVLIESARITRGDVHDLQSLDVSEFDGVFIPGGFGAAKNLSDFATQGDKFTVDPIFSQKLIDFNNQNKIIASCCITPLVISKVFENSNKNVKLTLGNKGSEADWPYQGTIDIAKSLNSDVQMNNVDQVTIDSVNRILTTPAFMYGQADNAQIFLGTQKLVDEAIKLAEQV